MSPATSQQLFTLLVYSENCVGLLNQVSGIFTRRCLNIEDVAASKSSVPDITKLIITCWADRPTSSGKRNRDGLSSKLRR